LSSHFIKRARFDDFDQFAHTIRSWDLDFIQLDRGRFIADLLQFGAECFQISNACFNRHLIQRGETPQGFRTFAVPEEASSGFIWRGKKINRDSIMVFPPGEGLDAVSFKGFKVYTLSFSEQLLDAAGDQIGLPLVCELLKGSEVVVAEPSSIEDLRRLLQKLCRELMKKPSLIENRWFLHDVVSELPRKLFHALSSYEDWNGIQSYCRRHRVMRRVEEYIAENQHEPLTVHELCRIAESSERTLRYAFHKRFGVSPKSYLNALRLNGVRRELRQCRSDRIMISDIANDWGFWHMGQFAADYRKLFGELPSETLSNQ
jgi:AraC family ethanolamine operon transcriptional activator